MSAIIEVQKVMISELMALGYPHDIVRDILEQTDWKRDAALNVLQSFDWENYEAEQSQPKAEKPILAQNQQMKSQNSGFNFLNGFDEQRQIQEALNLSLNKQDDQPIQTRLKESKLPIGLQNYGNTCYLSCLIQVYFYNPVLVKLILSYKSPANQDQNVKKYIKFLEEIQKMFVRMILRNEKYLKSQEIFEAVQQLEFKNEKLNRGDFKDVNEYFQFLLESIDKTLEKKFLKQQQQQGFLNEQLDSQYYIQTDKVNHFQLLLLRWTELKNIYNILYQQKEEIACEIRKLPDNLILNVVRNTEVLDRNQFQSKNSEEIILKPILFLDFLIGKSQQIEHFYNQTHSSSLQLLQARKEYDAFERTYKYFEKQPIVQLNVLESLKAQLEIKQKQQKTDDTLEAELAKNSKIKYYLAQVIIHVGSVNSGHYYLYQYNFYLQKWIKYNDTMVQLKKEDDVMADIAKNCNIVIYISESQQQKVYDFQRELIEIEQQRELRGKELFKSNITNNEIQKMIPVDIGKQVLEENEQFMKEYQNLK